MGLQVVTPQEGLNSKTIKNSQLSPGKLTMLHHQGVYPLSVTFNVVAREGQFSDTTIANYSPRGNSALAKFLLNEGSKHVPVFLKGELTTQYEGTTPKSINFDIQYRADWDLSPRKIIDNVQVLQSMCYPRAFIGLNPPLCLLQILNLYALEVYVQQVIVNWHNQWYLYDDPSRENSNHGLPMGCDISVTCLLHQTPTREEVLAGATFDSRPFNGKGYTLSPGEKGGLVLDHANPRVQEILQRDRNYVDQTASAAAQRKEFARKTEENRKVIASAPELN